MQKDIINKKVTYIPVYVIEIVSIYFYYIIIRECMIMLSKIHIVSSFDILMISIMILIFSFLLSIRKQALGKLFLGYFEGYRILTNARCTILCALTMILVFIRIGSITLTYCLNGKNNLNLEDMMCIVNFIIAFIISYFLTKESEIRLEKSSNIADTTNKQVHTERISIDPNKVSEEQTGKIKT